VVPFFSGHGVQSTSPGDCQRSCKVWLASGERRRCSNKAKTRNRLKFAGVPQTDKPISAQPLVGRSSTYCEDIWRSYCCLTTCSDCRYVLRCLSCEDTAQQSCAMVPRWRIFGEFCVLYFQRASRSTFQTCILNSHY